MNPLRKMLPTAKALPFVGAPSALMARLIEAHGFAGVYLSGAGLANNIHGIPDDGSISLPQLCQYAKSLCSASSLPVIADADTGFAEGTDTGACVRGLEKAGVAGIQIEDQVPAKKCGHLSGKQLVSSEEMCARISSAVAARQDPDTVLIARTDARSVSGWEDTLNRAKAYRQAGADMIFIEALPSAQEFQEFARLCPGPLLANMTEFGVSPLLPRADLKKWGYTVVIYPQTLLRVMLAAAEEALKKLGTMEEQSELLPDMWNRQQLYDLLDYQEPVP